MTDNKKLPKSISMSGGLAKMGAAAVILLSAIYIICSPLVAMPAMGKLIFQPSSKGNFQLSSIAGVPIQEVTFSAAGEKLHGWYLEKPGARGVLLYNHGAGGNISNRVPFTEAVLSQNYSILLYDYEGYGKSTGRPSIDGICRDGLAAYDFLVKTKNVAADRIVLLGESLGGGVACHIAKTRTIRGMILLSTYYSLPALAAHTYPVFSIYPRALFPANSLDNNLVLNKDHAPVLILHGDADKKIPVCEAQQLFAEATAPCQFVKVKGAAHISLLKEKLPVLQQEMKAFFDQLATKTVSRQKLERTI